MKKLKALKRERVNRVLENIFNYPITIIEAPIGYGKTTAVREFLAAKCTPVIWTSFISENDTAAWFWERLSGEISKIDMAAGTSLQQIGVPSDTPQTNMAISILGEMNYKPDTTLIIDDFHLTKNMKITFLLKRFAMEMPDDLHIVILTRDTTNLDIFELYVKGLCYVVSQNTLRFTESEIRDYCTMMGFSTSENEIGKICDYTGGWISLIYLILLGMERGISIDRNSVINELVEKVLYNAYDENIQRFLLRLSVMDSFTAKKAAFITLEEESEKILMKLRRENAFIAYDGAAGVYIIHNVLRDFLRGRLKDKEECSSLYRRLGEWHLAQREYRTAYGYLFRVKAQAKDQTGIMMCAYFVLIRLYIYQGKIDEALELLQQLRNAVTQKNNPYYNSGLDMVEGYVNGCLNRADKIPGWLQAGDVSSAHFFYGGMGFYNIIYGKALLLSKNYLKLETLTDEFARSFAPFCNQFGFLHNQIFRASAKYPLYGMEAGCAALREAFDMARQDHLILIFAEYAPNITDMVRYIFRTEFRDSYIKEVLSACEQYRENLKNSAQTTVSLTARELEILTLAAEGLRRDEIAAKLYVSKGTVQTHLHNIYMKLEVSGRTAAIRKAQILKLL